MNQTNPAVELKIATSRLLRWRIPLFLALIANISLAARMAFLPVGAVAAQPTIAVAPTATHKPAGTSTDLGPATPSGAPQTSPETSAIDIAKYALSASQTESRANPPASATSSPAQKPSTHVLEYVPALTELATDWWPAVESAAEAAGRVAAAQLPQAGGLTISNRQQNGVPVSFLVDGRVYTLHPGESHLFPVGTSWELQFHRGGPFGTTRESFPPGTYQFVAGPEGWTLQPFH